ncbi:MAG: AAA family ATPase, partial [Candidatus Rokubacteria bacterium]|nr:AAA family ATPase [Candidatus Rokubacteria bacterium]
PYEVLMELRIHRAHFFEALKEVEPSALREITLEVPDVRWEDVGGLDAVKQELVEAIEWPLRYAALFQYARARPPRGILLHGAPGTGKTLLAKAVATESRANFIAIKGPQLMSKWVGESERAIREVFKKAKQAAPCLIFLDELDALAPRRGLDPSGVSERVLSQLLTELDGIEELRGVVVLAATNRLDMVDPALLRPGRFDSLIEIPMPDEGGRLEIFRVHTRGKPLAKDVNLTVLARDGQGLVGADIEAICRKAAMMAIREYLEACPWGSDPGFQGYAVRMGHLVEALKSLAKGGAP